MEIWGMIDRMLSTFPTVITKPMMKKIALLKTFLKSSLIMATRATQLEEEEMWHIWGTVQDKVIFGTSGSLGSTDSKSCRKSHDFWPWFEPRMLLIAFFFCITFLIKFFVLRHMRSRSKHGKALHSCSQNLGKEKRWRSLKPQRTALCLNPSTHSCLVIISDVCLKSCTDCISQDWNYR